ncbi:ribonuclease H-like domain-containing protein, partial [Tanacetum coccineum]
MDLYNSFGHASSKAKLRSIKLGDLSMEAYFMKITLLVTILTSLDSPVNDEDFVHFAIEGNSRRPPSSQVKSWKPCFNFAKGSCRFSASCKYVHDAQVKWGSNSRVTNVAGDTSIGSSTNNTPNELLLKLLGQLGNLGLTGNSNLATCDVSNTGNVNSPHVAYNTNLSPLPMATGPNPMPAYLSLSPPVYYPTQSPLYYSMPGPPGFPPLLAQPTAPVLIAQPTAVQPTDTGPTTSVIGTTHLLCQATTLPHAFNAITLQDPASNAWNMDTGATSYLNNSVLLRCDSTRDLYPVMDPSPVPHSFLVSQEKPHVLCHACQLGKHVRLPFASLSTMVTSCFDIIHSDVWASPIPSLS